ncbi:MAG: hypothetical protein IJ928_06725 [Prevotella sp.]|nr:hypothetical protein [Prevotella sp.]
MKKTLLILTFIIVSLTSFGQIFSKIRYYDKFDDCIKTEKIKTLITKTDSTFIIEEKGRKPVEYWIINHSSFNSSGDKDNIVDLTGKNVYGFQDSWCVIKMSDLNDYNNHLKKILLDEEPIAVLTKYWLFVVHRTISRYSFEFQYEREYFWIENEMNDNKLGKNINRIIYTDL